MLKYFFGLCLVACVWARHELYDGHALYDVSVSFSDQAESLYELRNTLDIDVWSKAVPGRSGQILVPKNLRETFEEVLKADGIEYNVAVENIKEKLDLEDTLLKNSARNSHRSNRSISFDNVYTNDEVNELLEELAKNYPQTVTLVNAGKSVEGRVIKYLKISSDGFQSRNKPVVFLQSLLHAREWVTLPATLYAIKKLVIDVSEQDLVQDVDWIVLPVANPDGYVYSHELDRFWRKNRATGSVPGSSCIGVDLNRNFDTNWAAISSNNPCSETYHGTAPFSEPETAAIRDIFAEYADKIELYIDIHSYGSLILYGWGDGKLTGNALGLQVLGVNMAQAIDAVKLPTNRNYIVGNSAAVLYATSGVSNDYAFEVGVPFSYCYELPAYRNMGSFLGFLLDPDFIEQAGYETWEGIRVGAKFVIEELSRRNKDLR